MNEPGESVQVCLRIPGTWSHPSELLERMPEGYRLTPEALILPDQTEIEFGAMGADNQFAQIFRSSLRQQAADDELEAVDRYTVNALLAGPGGSLESARTMMQAAAALVRAGGAGVFIDNSGLAHGAAQWLRMTDDGSSDAISFAFVSIIGSRTHVWTMGMHVLGHRDVLMKRTDADDFDIIEVIRYMAGGEKPVGEGHILGDLDGPRFQTFADQVSDIPAGSPMHNPFGRLKLISIQEIAETN